MSISLQKGQKISLSKESSGLSKITVGLGWDEPTITEKGSGLFAKKKVIPIDIDCDASALLLKNGKLSGKDDIVYYVNLDHESGSVNHLGDNLTGAGDGDDEQIVVDLQKVPAEYDRIVFVVNIYRAKDKNQHFGMINNAFIRIVDNSTNSEICKYDLSEDYTGMTAMIFGEIYKNGGEWKFNAIGQGTTDDNINEVAQRYQ
ncbi:MAG: TerD family protein [Lachnospiraceae bacterium]|nr:TerD family protein [Lachnospiraceae bacterium]